MTMNKDVSDFMSINEIREQYIKALDSSKDRDVFIRENAESLFSLGLTMYSDIYSFASAAYNGLAQSKISKNRSLHPEQIKILKEIESHKGLVLSAPTSFGKTFSVFEYIARKKPRLIVLVVPTLALVDEYKRKIINEYKAVFEEYKVHLSIKQDQKYDLEKKNIFIVTHDRAVNEDVHNIFKSIDFLVIDEVYKLQKDEKNERVLILNIAYYNMVRISKKYVLLAPFISGIQNMDKLDPELYFYNTNYSPVVNDVKTICIQKEKDRLIKTKSILEEISGKTLVYFSSVKKMNDYILSCTDTNAKKKIIENEKLQEFIKWAREEVHEEWTPIKAIENGMLIHHGQLPMGIRMIELDLFENSSDYNIMLCTSTLLEGVNTTAENVIITKPAKATNPFDAFDFYNLVGRTGRLFKHYLGKAYYIRGPRDKEYIKGDALKSIEFELTSDSIDIDIYKGAYEERVEFVDFLRRLETSYENYKTEVATKIRYKNAVLLFERYDKYKMQLLDEIDNLISNREDGNFSLIQILYRIIEGNTYDYSICSFVITLLIYNVRYGVKYIINQAINKFNDKDVQEVIRIVLEKKNSYIEHVFYKKIQIILFYMKCQGVEERYISFIQQYLVNSIEEIYYIHKPAHRMLKDMGIYEKDIPTIIGMIGSDFQTVGELQILLRQHDVRNRIGFVSRYIINKLEYTNL